MDLVDEGVVLRRRKELAIAWSFIAAAIAVSAVAEIPRLVLVTWLAVLGLLVVTSRWNRAEREERLERPRVYRAIAGAVVVLAVAGCVFGAFPSSSEASSLAVPFFGGIAFLGYRAAVARGPRPTLLLVTLASFGWVWGGGVFLVRCKCHHHSYEWTREASRSVFLVELVLIAALVAVTLISFRRRDGLPDARVVG